MSTYEFDRDNPASNAFSAKPDNNLADFSFSTENANLSVKDPELYGKTYDYIPGGVQYTIEMQRLADCMEEGDIKGFIKSMLILESIPTACEKPDFKKYLSLTITNAIAKLNDELNSNIEDPQKLYPKITNTLTLISDAKNAYGVELTEAQIHDLDAFTIELENNWFNGSLNPSDLDKTRIDF